jgi:hypothetical protein
MKKIFEAIKEFLNDELVNDIDLPENLLDARTDQEVSERYYYLYHEILGTLAVYVANRINKKSLSNKEILIISERLEAFLIERGF